MPSGQGRRRWKVERFKSRTKVCTGEGTVREVKTDMLLCFRRNKFE
jgi:hypothetical protein